MMKGASDVSGKSVARSAAQSVAQSVAQKLLWISYPKGAARIKSDITRDPIWRTARTLGLEGVAMVAVDDTWSAMRLKVGG
jgi:hypothetical protein